MPYKTKVCPNCNDPFTPHAPSQQFCRKDLEFPCPECGITVHTICSSPHHQKTFCSSLCGSKNVATEQKRSQTVENKYGVANVMKKEEVKTKVHNQQKQNNNGKFAFNTEKQKQTNIQRYGGASPMHSEVTRRKVETTQKQNNNGKFAFNTEKQKQTMLERYGSFGPLPSPEVFRKQQDTMIQKYGVKRPSQHPEFLKKSIETIIANNGSLFGNETISKINKQFAQDLHQKGITCSYEKTVDTYSYDLFYEPTNLLIDLNPTVTHNSTLPFACLRLKCPQPCLTHEPKPKTYHYKRAQTALRNGFKLVQIYDWEDSEKILQFVLAKTLIPKIKIKAHHLTLQTIPQAEANQFLQENHLQGSAKKQTHCYGLYTPQNQLVAVMTFSKPRFTSNYEYELNRFATKTGYQIYGAASKMFNQFITETQPKTIISYLDFNHSTTKNTYLNHLKFKETEPTGPTLIWSQLRNPRMIRQTSLNKIGADRLLKTSYGKNYSNEEIMTTEGYVKIYTAGNRVFIWENPKT